MARLLVSVRSAEEARAAVSGGADIIDVKEPAAGPLGCADPTVWSEIRRVVPMATPLSVALGELADWSTDAKQFPPADAWGGITYAKMGLSGSGTDWLARWKRIRTRFERDLPAQCSWVAVIYADWLAAEAPSPDEILAVALGEPRCAGVLVDTWSKGVRAAIDLSASPGRRPFSPAGAISASSGRQPRVRRGQSPPPSPGGATPLPTAYAGPTLPLRDSESQWMSTQPGVASSSRGLHPGLSDAAASRLAEPARNHEWQDRLGRVQRSGRFFAWAGGLDVAKIERFIASGLKPDIIAVRGAACRDGNRLGPIDAGRVARLREAAVRV